MSEDALLGEHAAAPRTQWRTIWLGLVALLGVLVIGALVLTVGDANRARDEALTRQRHSYEVMILARSLSQSVAEAEATLGRYILSGDKEIGRLYFESWLRADSQLNRLRKETVDNPEQRREVAALRTAFNERGGELAQAALNTRYKKNNTAMGLFFESRNSPARAQMEARLGRVLAGERALLEARSGRAAATVRRSNQVAAALMAFGGLLVLGAIALGWATAEALAERAVAHAETDAARDRAAELERAVSAATEKLQEEARERESAEARLRQSQKMEAVGQLTGGIAHDFNNMLAVVIGGLELANRSLGGPADASARHIDNALEGAGRAAALTRRLLSFAREDSLTPEPTEMGALIAGMSELLDRTLGDTITVVTRDEGKGWRTFIDRHQLENAILNLAVNARDAMNGRGTLTFATGGETLAQGAVGGCAPGDYVTVCVTDTGSGMTAEVLERAFEPFFTTKPVGKGTGLGLSQLFGFMRQSGGEIAIRSAPGEGTSVTLYLPRHAAPVAKPRPVAALPVGTPALVPAALAILVVEDDARVLTATIGALEELGHNAVACDDPLRAADAARAMPRIDLILSDVLMPGRTGPELVAELLRERPGTPVLFVTGYAGEGDGAGLEGFPVLRKPFTLVALERALGEAVADTGPAEPLALAG